MIQAGAGSAGLEGKGRAEAKEEVCGWGMDTMGMGWGGAGRLMPHWGGALES